jgi:ankyrin repeat protein
MIVGHLEMVKFLLEAGADQEHKTDEMHTALMEASMDGHVEVARLLLDSGAQVTICVFDFNGDKNIKGTPLRWGFFYIKGLKIFFQHFV